MLYEVITGLAQAHAVERVAHAAGVGEMRVHAAALQVVDVITSYSIHYTKLYEVELILSSTRLAPNKPTNNDKTMGYNGPW